MNRELTASIEKDLQKKIVVISGPRQSGKTTLAKAILTDSAYLNYDLAEHRLMISEKSWDRKKSLIIFDELHKMTHWKQWLKGIYDTKSSSHQMLVTGSAKMDVFRKVGDSLAGRFFLYRMHPFDCRELKGQLSAQECFERLWQFGPFPEPFLEANTIFYKKWQRSHLDVILRQDLIDLVTVSDIQAVETLIERLKYSVGSPISHSNLARDLQKDPKTIKRWLLILEALYIVFRVTPYHKNVARALLKEPKYYFYDSAQVLAGDGAKLENIVACSLLKEAHFLEDVWGDSINLHYLRTKDGREIDFLIESNNNSYLLVEVKSKEATLSRQFKHFSPFFKQAKRVQLVLDLPFEKTMPDGAEIRSVVSQLETGIIQSAFQTIASL